MRRSARRGTPLRPTKGEARTCGEPEVGEVEPFAVGDDVREVRVEVLDALPGQELGDCRGGPARAGSRGVVAGPPARSAAGARGTARGRWWRRRGLRAGAGPPGRRARRRRPARCRGWDAAGRGGSASGAGAGSFRMPAADPPGRREVHVQLAPGPAARGTDPVVRPQSEARRGRRSNGGAASSMSVSATRFTKTGSPATSRCQVARRSRCRAGARRPAGRRGRPRGPRRSSRVGRVG